VDSPGYINSCAYGTGLEMINVSVSTVKTRAKFDEAAASEKQIFGSAYHEVNGVGDAAHLVDTIEGGTFDVVKGRIAVHVLISHNVPHPGDIIPLLTVLGTAAAGHV